MFLQVRGGLRRVWVGWLVVNMAVSSAKVLRIVLSDCGRSTVYNVYNKGPRMLPWGTPESIGSKVDVLLLSETVKYLSLR